MEYAPIKDEITFDDFAKIDVRVGLIVEVSEVAKSDKLMKLIAVSYTHLTLPTIYSV